MAASQSEKAMVIRLTWGRGDDLPLTVVKTARHDDHRASTQPIDIYDDRLRAVAESLEPCATTEPVTVVRRGHGRCVARRG